MHLKISTFRKNFPVGIDRDNHDSTKPTIQTIRKFGNVQTPVTAHRRTY